MIDQIRIENYKSIEDVKLSLGRVNVFIGENGAGKSNILEAIALAAAAEAGKLDNEFLSSRGIRVSSAELMRAAFQSESVDKPISITVQQKNGNKIKYDLNNDNKPYSSWSKTTTMRGESIDLQGMSDVQGMSEFIRDLVSNVGDEAERRRIIDEVVEQFRSKYIRAINEKEFVRRDGKEKILVDISVQSEQRLYGHHRMNGFEDFLIYSPESSSLRSYEKVGQIEPLGINGEGLFKFLEFLAMDKDNSAILAIKRALKLFGWFVDFSMENKQSIGQMRIVDHFMSGTIKEFDQRSANEGFLFVAFYFSLLSSNITPKFFAIDNVDTSLNPKLCQELMKRISQLSLENGKQVILTTHNPAILDGLDINDPDQRLFVVSRKRQGQTQIRRFEKKPVSEKPTRLSELFVRGALGGLPKSF